MIGNSASGRFSSVGGGFNNDASGQGTVIDGGLQNTASGRYATVGGGSRNDAAGTNATVAGGRGNAATGDFAEIPGGRENQATGTDSFAAGRKARAVHDGAFVWGDSFNAQKPSSAPDTFNVYASGGATFYSNSAATTGVTLVAGGGAWSMLSDEERKENFEEVDSREVLERVCALPMTTWNYKAQDDSVRHMGPMAQDFHAAFGLGANDRLINTVDSHGVALAAIQGLYHELAERDAEIADLRAAQAELVAEVARLRERLP